MNRSSERTRRFARELVTRLVAVGYQAFWAGGCVRDYLLGREPHDFDVATDAKPHEVRAVFGQHRTVPVGAAFGVITVLGPRDAAPIDVATFRQDATYSDGRRPDHVTFCGAEQDAQRRDFTINGLFFDPLAGQVIDYVGGQADLNARMIRAIGDPEHRFDEDKLRMLRAIRFAATLDFSIDSHTLESIGSRPEEVLLVSAERIAGEMRRMLAHANRREAIRLAITTGLLRQIVPEFSHMSQLEPSDDGTNSDWAPALRTLANPCCNSFESGLALLLHPLLSTYDPGKLADDVCNRWRLSNHEMGRVRWLLKNERRIRQAVDIPWPSLQRLLVSKGSDELQAVAQAVAEGHGETTSGTELARRKLRLPKEQLDPDPILNGCDLIELGIPRGKHYQRLLTSIRDAQLEGQVRTMAQATDLARKLWTDMKST